MSSREKKEENVGKSEVVIEPIQSIEKINDTSIFRNE